MLVETFNFTFNYGVWEHLIGGNRTTSELYVSIVKQVQLPWQLIISSFTGVSSEVERNTILSPFIIKTANTDTRIFTNLLVNPLVNGVSLY